LISLVGQWAMKDHGPKTLPGAVPLMAGGYPMLHPHVLREDIAGLGSLQYIMLDVEFAQLSDPGRVRDHNEDYLGYVYPATPDEMRSHGCLFVLADGVGGHDKGEVASRTAVESILAGFRGASAGEPHSPLLSRLVQTANTRVLEAGMASSSGGISMATTLVSCALRYDRALVAHVGDSRCYLVRRGEAVLLTRDHTLVGEQMRLGLLSAREAADSPHRHLLSRSLGAEMFANVETNEYQILADDVLVLCSDGLHGAVSPSEIAAIVSHQTDLNAAAHRLVAVANHQDGTDNISVQLIRVRSVERVGMYRGRPYRLR
jgi:serine/threonine protein phosphatase PrpC